MMPEPGRLPVATTCPVCSGVGFVNKGRCTECGGSGFIHIWFLEKANIMMPEMTPELLNVPPTAAEVADLCAATQPAPEIHGIARRLAWQRDNLQAALEAAGQQQARLWRAHNDLEDRARDLPLIPLLQFQLGALQTEVAKARAEAAQLAVDLLRAKAALDAEEHY